MPGDGVKQRKPKADAAAPNKGDPQHPCNSPPVSKDGEKVTNNNAVCGRSSPWAVDVKAGVSFLALSGCFVLALVVFQQSAKFNEVEKKYNHLYEKTADLLVLEKKFSAVSEKLEASEDHLKRTLSSIATLKQLQHDVTSLNNIITMMEEDQQASSRRLQSVNEHFLNVTETWQGGLSTVTEDLTTLRSESHLVHSRVTEHVNKAEGRLSSLTKRLEELEDSTRRNGRALERTEEEDAKSVQQHLDWNTRQVTKLQEQFHVLSRNDEALKEKLVETEPQAKQCVSELPVVEEAVRSILRLGADLSGVERRLEELTLQVVNTEDSMLKSLAEILDLQQTINKLQVDNSVIKVRTDLGDLMDNVKELIHQQSKLELEEQDEQDDERDIMKLIDALNDLDSNSFPGSTGTLEEKNIELNELL